MGIILKPIVTEKMMSIGEKYNRFGFRVLHSANKIEMKKKSRYTKAGVINGMTATYKKAIVTLKEGDKIDFYSNI